MDPLRDNGYKTRRIRSADYIEVKKVSKENPYQLKEGDRIISYGAELEDKYGGLEEGTAMTFKVTRGDLSFTIPYTIKYRAGSKKYFIRFQRNPTAEQLALRKYWFKN